MSILPLCRSQTLLLGTCCIAPQHTIGMSLTCSEAAVSPHCLGKSTLLSLVFKAPETWPDLIFSVIPTLPADTVYAPGTVHSQVPPRFPWNSQTGVITPFSEPSRRTVIIPQLYFFVYWLRAWALESEESGFKYSQFCIPPFEWSLKTHISSCHSSANPPVAFLTLE